MLRDAAATQAPWVLAMPSCLKYVLMDSRRAAAYAPYFACIRAALVPRSCRFATLPLANLSNRARTYSACALCDCPPEQLPLNERIFPTLIHYPSTRFEKKRND